MLGLVVATDPRWAPLAVADLDALLVDHAHCELKAASNAMSLVARYGGMIDVTPAEVVRRLSDLAEEEIQHFRRVLAEIERRGGTFGVPGVDDYAQRLRTRAAALPWSVGRPRDRAVSLVERLIVGALIEARSAERFKLLVDALPDGDDVRVFYTELFASEARHYRVFLDLATLVAGDEVTVRERHAALAEVEGEVVRELARQGVRGTIHG